MGPDRGVIDPAGVEAARAPLNPMHHVALFQQELRQVAAVLSGYAGDKGGFRQMYMHGSERVMNWRTKPRLGDSQLSRRAERR